MRKIFQRFFVKGRKKQYKNSEKYEKFSDFFLTNPFERILIYLEIFEF